MQAEIKRIFRSAAEGVDSRYFYPEEGQQAVTGTYGVPGHYGGQGPGGGL